MNRTKNKQKFLSFRSSIFSVFALALATVVLVAGLLRNGDHIKAASPIVQEQLVTNTALSTPTITLGSVQGGTNQLYVLILANHKNKPVTSVSGLNLTWTQVVSQCSGQNTNGMTIFTAFGSPATSGSVVATLGSTSNAIAATLLRYSGVDPSLPVSDAHGQNTKGPNGSCSGGIDNANPQITLTSSRDSALRLAAVNIRSRTMTTADSDYVQKTNIVVGSSGAKTRLLLHDRYPFGAGADTINHTVSGTVDWVMTGLVINPADSVQVSPTATPLVTPTATPLVTPTATPSLPSPTPTPGPGGGVVFVGAGDIASCTSQGDEATANLLDQIQGTVFTLGDNAYPNATTAEFNTCYEPTWGRHKNRTQPVVGNHEYNSPGASPHFAYFGASANAPTGYYSYELGAWHIIVVNSNCSQVGGCTAGSPQEQWLRADLASHTNACTLAMWHHPLFSSGAAQSDRTRPLWDALYEHNADVILTGHAHVYERFAPQTPGGGLDTVRGIREFIVGTGGASHGTASAPIANSEVRNDNTYGVIKLTLRNTDYDWQFIPEAGKTFTDAGTGTCH